MQTCKRITVKLIINSSDHTFYINILFYLFFCKVNGLELAKSSHHYIVLGIAVILSYQISVRNM